MIRTLNKLVLIALLGIMVLGFFLRLNNLYTWPRSGATFDEYAWTWQGVSIIKSGIPTSWSYHPQYKVRKEIRYQTVPFIMVTPYLEHPPLFGLVAGGYALVNGVHGMYDVNLYKIRGLALLLGMVSVFIVFLLGRKMYGTGIGLLASLLYSTIPTIVIGSRIVQNENFMIPVWLASLYFAVCYLGNKKVWMRNIAVVLSGLLILAKIPWIAAPFSLCIIFLYHKKYKDTLITIAITTFFLLIYFVYGFYYDKDVFLALWGLQLNRYDITFTSIYAFFQKPYLADRFYTDGWIFWGFISFILLSVKGFKKHVVLVSAVTSYFLIFLSAIPDEAGHGWYRYPFYPFLVVSIALFIKEYFAKNWLLTFLFLIFVGTSLFEVVWTPIFGFSYIIFRIIIVLCGLVLIPQYIENNKIEKAGKIVSYLLLSIFILMNIWAVMIYNEQ